MRNSVTSAMLAIAFALVPAAYASSPDDRAVNRATSPALLDRVVSPYGRAPPATRGPEADAAVAFTRL